MASSTASRPGLLLLLPLLASALYLGSDVREAHACGCFAPPSPVVPVVQAGERIVFAVESGRVTAHIQIQYAGNSGGSGDGGGSADGGEFGWLLPLPAVPEVGLGTDELFAQLTAATQPAYELERVYEGDCNPLNFYDSGVAVADCDGGDPDGICAEATDDGATVSGPAPFNPLVLQAAVGPYDYAVLRADRKQPMLDWLAANRYYVPAGVTDVVTPYIRPGAYFLALKLRTGEVTGALQPVVVSYPSDLPMIPIVLTQVAAQPDMGIQVFVLGGGRAIPRNYHHTVLNDARLDWIRGGANYNDLVIAATREAPGRHTFVTEFAGSSALMQGVLDYPGRFGNEATLAASPDEVWFFTNLLAQGFAISGQLQALLQAAIPFPPGLASYGVTPAQFYTQLDYYLGYGPMQFPEAFIGYRTQFDAPTLARQVFERIVQPTRAAARLFDRHPVLTRLYTTLSPEDMTADPVFSFHLDGQLPDVSNRHNGRLTYHCRGYEDFGEVPATLVTESGFVLEYPDGTGEDFSFQPAAQDQAAATTEERGPGSLRIERLGEEGPAEVVVDNAGAVQLARVDPRPPLSPGPRPPVPELRPDRLGPGTDCAVMRGVRGLGRSHLLAMALLLVAGLALTLRRPLP
jgi:hypothetical protein